ncbi:MAG: GCN5-related N-acetyltransferase [uncultured bacterium]|uniref:N-acetyltransferase domain-containing protein n=1 Tax=Candidatus Curtissbacteria bacterium RIFOXYA1_FULL_41_14 TaxID=1797737 RepID=A0A1F5HCR9_9BACT|nr:MAG: GCN5-related N-acetyltransferase [uncultured bacterium]KKR57866.1 MAG: GCN5-related N-acetyltransferase [Candidatus Curtissbacteria bacterium GW2011_GWB1_40_28]KKR61087.1 MAG: GCN5-related N-acetyltransferase [Candidatus Curtissbacteria bacterium GW2011_GWA2_40_31]KKR61967.1 MAG: GCN5-related N-acetyltransferase [Microgenomates group bacterium GW2011_GWC1_40_35]KKR66099.1 MAG: GCN5-related N-acetyltransferase [Candidatus Curtissbacteria bacterium GW2011_GWA1_40_47]KKS02224.1 MAG: GCN5-
MQIKLATKDDLEGILALQDQVYRVKEPHADAKKILVDLIDAAHCDIVVAKQNNKIIGSATLLYFPIPAYGKPYAFLEGLVVDKNSRKKGVGTALLNKLIELAREKGCYKVVGTSRFASEDVHKFYEKLGFTKWGWEFRMDLA